jgi:gamma-glutamyltranspeptidase/glutathione hydrolase
LPDQRALGAKWWAAPFHSVTQGTGPPVVAGRGMVATSNPLACAAALQMLEAGGTAADAAVAADAVSGVVDPHLTGIGGDCAAIVYAPAERAYLGLNATGPAPSGLHREVVLSGGRRSMPTEGPLSVTVPGTVGGWAALLRRFGRLPIHDVLKPAIDHARRGFPVAPVTSAMWADQVTKIRRHSRLALDILTDGETPGPAELRRVPRLAETLSTLAACGLDSFYGGPIGQALCQTIERGGGVLTAADLVAFSPEWVTPLSLQYCGCRVLELPPNTQGATVLFALRLLQAHIDDHGSLPPWGSAGYVALLAHAISRALTMRDAGLADPTSMTTSAQDLLANMDTAVTTEKDRLGKGNETANAGNHAGDTVYIAVADEAGLMVSFISSIFHHFGSGILDAETGVILQNRAAAFRLDSGHVQDLAPGRRPLHTIIPAAAELSGGQRLSLGLTGADMQPQGQLQLLCNLVNFGMNIQEALDAPRIRIGTGNTLALEGRLASLRQAVELTEWKTESARSLEMGAGQLVLHDPATGVLVGGTERRRDGCVLGR